MIKIFTGTYSTHESIGIYAFEMDEESGTFSKPYLFSKTTDSKYLWIGKEHLISAANINSKAGTCLIDYENGNIEYKLLYEKTAPCYVCENNDIIYSANFHEGSVFLYDKTPKLKKRIDIKEAAGCHQIILINTKMLIPCMNLDIIKIFDHDTIFIKDIVFPKNSGPRHGILTQDFDLYVVGEKDNRLYKLDNNFNIIGSIDIIKNNSENTSAAIRLHPNKNIIYISTRGSDIITVFDISGKKPKMIDQKTSGGSHPRDFFVAPNGKFIVVANRFSNEVVSIKLNEHNGLIENIIDRVSIVEATALAYKFY